VNYIALLPDRVRISPVGARSTRKGSKEEGRRTAVGFSSAAVLNRVFRQRVGIDAAKIEEEGKKKKGKTEVSEVWRGTLGITALLYWLPTGTYDAYRAPYAGKGGKKRKRKKIDERLREKFTFDCRRRLPPGWAEKTRPTPLGHDLTPAADHEKKR